uniref:Inhibitory synaptic factor 1 n=1 Tax=Serinus canaria TaxID=9135 RepID=A0A8C9NHA2_SERCA
MSLGVPQCPFVSLHVPRCPPVTLGVPRCPSVSLRVPPCPLGAAPVSVAGGDTAGPTQDGDSAGGQQGVSLCPHVPKVVSQIDRLTSDFALDLEPDAWTPATASSTSSSDRGGASLELGPLDFAASDVLSDSWEFCSFLDASTPSDPGDCPEPPRLPPARLMNGGVPVANGPRGGGGPRIPPARNASGAPPFPKSRPSGRKPGVIPIRRATRNSSTQTVADKSTQTLLPYVPARQRIPNKN